jgi:hypothetical protein
VPVPQYAEDSPTGEPALPQRAAEQLGIEIETATPAVAAGLIEMAGQVGVLSSDGSFSRLLSGIP